MLLLKLPMFWVQKWSRDLLSSLPLHYMTAFRTHALVTKERMASPFDYGLSFQEFWTAHPRDRVLGSKTYALSTQITGFSICNPMYDNKHMLKVVQHAAASALINEEELATFILLPNWTESSTNAFHKTSTDNRDVCTILGIIPQSKVCYMPRLYQQNKSLPLSKIQWRIRILVVWNKAAIIQPIANNQTWLINSNMI